MKHQASRNMNTNTLEVGAKLQAIKPRFIFGDGDQNQCLWLQGAIMLVQGVIQHHGYREFLVNNKYDEGYTSLRDYELAQHFRVLA